jgi:hypothetical protein
MDEIVKQAMAKWPNVPHCYGWLALDARGAWRMRDERAQALNLHGDKITNPALLGFIHRNYTHDQQGRWYFQNGPQRVYVNLEATPYIARTDPAHGFILHTGEPLGEIEAAWLAESGQLILKNQERIALVDDRDMAQCISLLRLHGKMIEDEPLLDWISNPSNLNQLTLQYAGKSIPIQRIQFGRLASVFGYITTPRPD